MTQKYHLPVHPVDPADLVPPEALADRVHPVDLADLYHPFPLVVLAVQFLPLVLEDLAVLLHQCRPYPLFRLESESS